MGHGRVRGHKGGKGACNSRSTWDCNRVQPQRGRSTKEVVVHPYFYFHTLPCTSVGSMVGTPTTREITFGVSRCTAVTVLCSPSWEGLCTESQSKGLWARTFTLGLSHNAYRRARHLSTVAEPSFEKAGRGLVSHRANVASSHAYRLLLRRHLRLRLRLQLRLRLRLRLRVHLHLFFRLLLRLRLTRVRALPAAGSGERRLLLYHGQTIPGASRHGQGITGQAILSLL